MPTCNSDDIVYVSSDDDAEDSARAPGYPVGLSQDSAKERKPIISSPQKRTTPSSSHEGGSDRRARSSNTLPSKRRRTSNHRQRDSTTTVKEESYRAPLKAHRDAQIPSTSKVGRTAEEIENEALVFGRIRAELDQEALANIKQEDKDDDRSLLFLGPTVRHLQFALSNALPKNSQDNVVLRSASTQTPLHTAVRSNAPPQDTKKPPSRALPPLPRRATILSQLSSTPAPRPIPVGLQHNSPARIPSENTARPEPAHADQPCHSRGTSHVALSVNASPCRHDITTATPSPTNSEIEVDELVEECTTQAVELDGLGYPSSPAASRQAEDASSTYLNSLGSSGRSDDGMTSSDSDESSESELSRQSTPLVKIPLPRRTLPPLPRRVPYPSTSISATPPCSSSSQTPFTQRLSASSPAARINTCDTEAIFRFLDEAGLSRDYADALQSVGVSDDARMYALGALSKASFAVIDASLEEKGLDIVARVLVREGLKRRAGKVSSSRGARRGRGRGERNSSTTR